MDINSYFKRNGETSYVLAKTERCHVHAKKRIYLKKKNTSLVAFLILLRERISIAIIKSPQMIVASKQTKLRC